MKQRRHSSSEICETSTEDILILRNSILLAAILKMNPKLISIANFLSLKKKSTGLLSAFVEEPELQASDLSDTGNVLGSIKITTSVQNTVARNESL
jgi:hypothetical protein